MSESLMKLKRLQDEFEEKLDRELEQNEIEFLQWLANKKLDDDMIASVECS
ncbi:hypothetical protein [Jeotgalibacillus marinus]|uniref:Uncharacterized protein n=1 Tax=Jeotgalibacillus marinus TaxID=86667 RepID=A0ABV3Q1I0_9BACL